MTTTAILGAAPAFPEGLPLMRPRVPELQELEPILTTMRESGYMSNFGPISKQFEAAIANRLEVRHCLALSNLSTGLMYMPQAAGIAGGEVIVPSFTFVATVHSMVLAGLTPVFADIDPHNYCLDPASVAAAIGPNTVAVCGVHIYGTPCDVDGLKALCDQRGLKLFFDSAHGLGSHYQGKPLGGFGDAEGFSTSVTKVFTTLGEGGFITTNDDNVAENIRRARNWGHPGDYNSTFPSIVSKLPEIAAGVGLLELDKLDAYVASRQALVAHAGKALNDIPGVSLPIIREGDDSGHKDFAIFIEPEAFGLTRDQVAECLNLEGIQSRAYYAPTSHQMAAYKEIPIRVPLTVTERAAHQALCLPLFNDMSFDVMDRLCGIIGDIQTSAPKISKKLGIQ